MALKPFIESFRKAKWAYQRWQAWWCEQLKQGKIAESFRINGRELGDAPFEYGCYPNNALKILGSCSSQ